MRARGKLLRNPALNCMSKSLQKTILLISQVYPPDPASVGQHMADAAEEMAVRGWRVVVLTANRGYDDPQEKFPKYELRNGVDVYRLPFSSFGKKTIAHRLVAQTFFCLQALLHGLFTRNLQTILVTTSPPMGSIVGWWVSLLRRVSVKYWVMDINPDQAVAMKLVSKSSMGVRILDGINKAILKRASRVIVLDRFMAKTLETKYPRVVDKMDIMPPWPMEGYLQRIEHEVNPFRQKHGLQGKFVVMYSGNHSLVHPLDTLLKAALRMQDEERVVFLFIGGGKGKAEVDQVVKSGEAGDRIRSLPYLPLEEIKYSLSAADVHVVSMGEEMVGIVHPCKFYGAMALAKPLLFLGPEECHVADVLHDYDCGWTIQHGDVEGMETQLRAFPGLSTEEYQKKSANAHRVTAELYGKDILSKQFCDILEGEERKP